MFAIYYSGYPIPPGASWLQFKSLLVKSNSLFSSSKMASLRFAPLLTIALLALGALSSPTPTKVVNRQQIPPCGSEFCLFHKRCVTDASGTHCVEIDPCSPNPCPRNYFCVKTGRLQHECRWAVTITGPIPTINANACLFRICPAGTTCLVINGSATCF
jgi:hypothetical protein